MKKFTTVLCSLVFMLSGVLMAFQTDNELNIGHGLNAGAEPVFIPIFDKSTMPLDLQFSLDKQIGKHDTVYINKTDTVEIIKTKWRRVPAPEPIVQIKTDTLYYIATQVGNKEGPADYGDIIYEVHKVDSIYPVNPNSPDIQGVTEEPSCICTSAEHIELVSLALCELFILDPRICLPAQQVRNSKGRMKYILSMRTTLMKSYM